MGGYDVSINLVDEAGFVWFLCKRTIQEGEHD